jgi:hypothetical protein
MHSPRRQQETLQYFESSGKEAMHAVSIPDALYVEAQRVAAASGSSVERIVAEAVKVYLHDDVDNLDQRFTPEVIAALDSAAAQADSGMVMTFDQYEARFQLKREAWLKEHADSQ